MPYFWALLIGHIVLCWDAGKARATLSMSYTLTLTYTLFSFNN
jgi:hypothetical protein